MTPDELLALAENATAGESHGGNWRVTSVKGISYITGKGGAVIATQLLERDARFIALSRTALPRALNALRKAEEEIAALTARVKRLEDFTRRMANTGGVMLDVRKLARAALKENADG